MRTISHFINGQSVTCTGAVTSPVYDPSTGQVQAFLEHGDAVVLAEAVAAAKAAGDALLARHAAERPFTRRPTGVILIDAAADAIGDMGVDKGDILVVHSSYDRLKPTVLPRLGQDLQVQVRQRDYGPGAVALAQRAQRGDVLRIGDRRHGGSVIGGVLGRGQGVGVGGHRGRVLGERRDDVVALAHAGEQDAYAAGGCHPPVSPLYSLCPETTISMLRAMTSLTPAASSL